MSINSKLLEDMKQAMKSHDKEKLSVIRMARAAIKNVEIEKRKDLSDEEVVEVLSKEVKTRREAIDGYRELEEDEEVERLEEELEVLMEYLPEQLTREELEEMVEKTIEEVNATDQSDLGRVMGALMPKVKGRADGKEVNQLVQKMLQS